jgi:hypothetical protein
LGRRIREYKKEIAEAMGACNADNVDLIDRTALAQLKARNGPGTPPDNTSMRSFLEGKSNN